MATVTGWGYWNSTQTEPSELLKQIDVEIQSDEECIRTTTGVASKYVAGQNLCAGEIVFHNAFSNFHQEPLKDRQLLIRGVWLWVHLSRVNFITVMYM